MLSNVPNGATVATPTTLTADQQIIVAADFLLETVPASDIVYHLCSAFGTLIRNASEVQEIQLAADSFLETIRFVSTLDAIKAEKGGNNE